MKNMDKLLLEGLNEGDFNKVRTAINSGADVNLWIDREISIKLDLELVEEFRYTQSNIKPDGVYVNANGQYYNLKKIKSLLEKGASPNSNYIRFSDFSLLHQAVRNNCPTLVEILISSGADLEAKDNSGETPLHSAAERNHLELAELLISSGAEVNVKRNDGSMPLHDAAANDSLAVAELLISSGAEVNVKDNSGWTPLHWAAYNNSLEIAQLLISSGADLEAKDNYGRTPYNCSDKRTKVSKLLKSKK